MRVVMDVVERGSGKRVRERVRRARCHDVVVEERPGSRSRCCTDARLSAAGAC